MFEYDSSLAKRLIDMHRNELLQDAEKDRLIRQARAAHPGLSVRIRIRLGQCLVTLGQKLQEQPKLSSALR